jgi:hypothetical protein
MKTKRFSILLVLISLTFCSCQSTYYKAREAFGGQRKRDIMVNRVREVRDAQIEVIQQFQYAFNQYDSVLNYQGQELVSKYRKLQAEFKKSRSKGRLMTRRIESVKDVAEPLFSEWEKELDKFQNEQLRTVSADIFLETRDRYDKLMASMEGSRAKVDSVLKAFKDQVLFLKHNLNAKAIDALDDEYNFLETEFEELIQRLQTSIEQSNAFIQTMTVGSVPDANQSETNN